MTVCLKQKPIAKNDNEKEIVVFKESEYIHSNMTDPQSRAQDLDGTTALMRYFLVSPWLRVFLCTNSHVTLRHFSVLANHTRPFGDLLIIVNDQCQINYDITLDKLYSRML